MSVVIPKYASDSGFIFKQYVNNYNRQLTKDDLDTMVLLCQEGKFQEFIDRYLVRKIFVSGLDSKEHVSKLISIVEPIIKTDQVDLFKFVMERLAHDHKVSLLHQLNINICNNNEIKQYLINKIENDD